MSGNGTDGAPLNIAAAKKAGRDLMPIIVIFVFAIIMTVAAITIFNFINAEPDDPEKLTQQEKIRQQDEIIELMQQGIHAMDRKEYDSAVQIFEKILTIMGEGKGQPVLRFEVNRNLAEAELARGNVKRAGQYLKEAEKYRVEIRHYLDTELETLHRKMKMPPGEIKP